MPIKQPSGHCRDNGNHDDAMRRHGGGVGLFHAYDDYLAAQPLRRLLSDQAAAVGIMVTMTTPCDGTVAVYAPSMPVPTTLCAQRSRTVAFPVTPRLPRCR